ncbi:MFS transporter [Jonesia quinghaiensis]|uniref:MFS transporter n=1 Tax=Jonesia quinghaiensis TaxID=262806 RepID=UPI0004067881|nr:MFS transporter [Jonesia quinghaiensis]
MKSPLAIHRESLEPGGFYGWHMVVYASIALAATGPGQTVGVSLFIDPLIADLGVSRSSISTAYMLGTLAGAFALPWIGRGIDRFGIRRSMLVIGFAFGGILMAMSLINDIVGLTAGFVGIRMAGQGALGLVATTSVAMWFSRRRGLATGIVSAIGAIGISSTPLILEGYLLQHGWRTAWVVEGLAIWVIVLPLAFFGIRNKPSDLKQRPDGPTPKQHRDTHGAPTAQFLHEPHVSYTRAQTLREPYFWLIASAVALSGLLTTAVSFHQISLLTSRGLTAAQAAANFIPQTVAGLAATLITGYLMDRFAGRWMIVGSMLTLAGALWWGTHVSPGISAIAFGAMLGSAGSMIRAVEAAALPRYFGLQYIGSIRGLVAAISVGGTACGPLLFATVFESTGTYNPALYISMFAPLALCGWAVFAREPGSRPKQHEGTSTKDGASRP